MVIEIAVFRSCVLGGPRTNGNIVVERSNRALTYGFHGFLLWHLKEAQELLLTCRKQE